jgi:peptidyl-tRNA hydrolase
MSKKMYILIKDSTPFGFAPLAAAHGSLSCYLRFEQDPEMREWRRTSFRKVVCRVSEAEFERAKQFEDNVIVTESSLCGMELALVFKPRSEYPKDFKFYRLWT